MIERFEAGKWYRYKGKKRLELWNQQGEMDFILDNKPHLCVHGRDGYADFKGDERGDGEGWWWGDLRNFYHCEEENEN